MTEIPFPGVHDLTNAVFASACAKPKTKILELFTDSLPPQYVLNCEDVTALLQIRQNKSRLLTLAKLLAELLRT